MWCPIPCRGFTAQLAFPTDIPLLAGFLKVRAHAQTAPEHSAEAIGNALRTAFSQLTSGEPAALQIVRDGRLTFLTLSSSSFWRLARFARNPPVQLGVFRWIHFWSWLFGSSFWFEGEYR